MKLPGSRRCFFLASEWQVGSPTYFVGGLHPVVDAVVSDSVLPIGRARRRLYSFGTRPGAPPEPLGLLTDRRAHNVAASDTPALHQDW